MCLFSLEMILSSWRRPWRKSFFRRSQRCRRKRRRLLWSRRVVEESDGSRVSVKVIIMSANVCYIALKASLLFVTWFLCVTDRGQKLINSTNPTSQTCNVVVVWFSRFFDTFHRTFLLFHNQPNNILVGVNSIFICFSFSRD